MCTAELMVAPADAQPNRCQAEMYPKPKECAPLG